MSHKNHPTCQYTSKAACEKAQREALGRCTELVAGKRRNEEPHQCQNWARSIVTDRPMCDTHAGAVLEREIIARKRAEKKAEADARTEAALAGQQARWQETIDWHAERKAKGLWPYS